MVPVMIKVGRSKAADMSFVELLCAANIASSSKKAKQLLKNGKIKVNGKVVKSYNFGFSALESFELCIDTEGLSYKVKLI